MVKIDYYATLNVSPQATYAEIKQAYRILVKQYHPDSNSSTGDHDAIVRINAAYEVLSDPQKRKQYDAKRQARRKATASQQRARQQNRRQRTSASQHTQATAGQDIDMQLHQWLQQVYKPVNRLLNHILTTLDNQVDELAADPFDDALMEEFQEYIEQCRSCWRQAQQEFRSMPNPSPVAKAAAHLYYCINQIGDGIEELEWFTLNYDESYLHAGQEMFRRASYLRWEAQMAVRDIF